MTASPQTIRLFIGTPLPEPLQECIGPIYQHRAQWEAEIPHRMVWVAPDRCHLTWLFLGNVPQTEVDSIRTRLTQALENQASPILKLHQTVFWPNPRIPKLWVWLGFDEGGNTTKLAHQIRGALPEYPEKKAFKPHITLARLKTSSQQCPKPIISPQLISRLQIPAQTWEIQQVYLYQSTLTPQCAVYESLASWDLG